MKSPLQALSPDPAVRRHHRRLQLALTVAQTEQVLRCARRARARRHRTRPELQGAVIDTVISIDKRILDLVRRRK
jgi:hypothetical protein